MRRLALFALLAALASPALAQFQPYSVELSIEQLYGSEAAHVKALIQALPKAKALSECSGLMGGYGGGVGYHPARFAGLPDPFPGNVILLPETAFVAAYLTRYGQKPGNPGERPDGSLRFIPGYANELFGVNWGTLRNAGLESGTGPSGEPFHSGCPAFTEALDLAFVAAKADAYYWKWYASRLPGATSATAIEEHEAALPCGPRSKPRIILGSYAIHYVNTPPCGSAPPPEPGLPDCPPELTTCKPLPIGLMQLSVDVEGWMQPWWSAARKSQVRSAMADTRAFRPVVQSTARMPCVLRPLP